jgi:2-dehydro-3-deoxyphosphogluconate aldolase/(4S)-4-hydroxy-2-oxoglutarate aldolase
MSHAETLSRIVATGIIPVVRAPAPELALRAVEALHAGGIDVIEVTMTVPGAVALIERLVQHFRDALVVGAGTVLDIPSAHACISAGARFVVSPTLDAQLIAFCRGYSIPVMPGALTPTEVLAAWRAGADLVKIFPCSAVGGADYVRALRAPLPQIALVPTGGVSLKTVGDFISAGATAVGAGADLVNIARLQAGDDTAVSVQARKYVEAVKAARRG